MYGDPETIRHLTNFKQLQGKFVYTQAAVFSANMIGQWACALSFGGVENLSQ